MSRVLIIGCGGVANVAIRKCCQASDIFTEICIASRTKSKCDALAESLKDLSLIHIFLFTYLYDTCGLFRAAHSYNPLPVS